MKQNRRFWELGARACMEFGGLEFEDRRFQRVSWVLDSEAVRTVRSNSRSSLCSLVCSSFTRDHYSEVWILEQKGKLEFVCESDNRKLLAEMASKRVDAFEERLEGEVNHLKFELVERLIYGRETLLLGRAIWNCWGDVEEIGVGAFQPSDFNMKRKFPLPKS